ncbi:MAG: molybdopterin oxidoreductase [Candidatus Methanoperedens sp.]|nr:molybdopterin oxidoreductase [Candidatus Methanoperedens sp.]
MQITRREFIKAGVGVGSLAIFGLGYSPVLKQMLSYTVGEPDNPDPVETAENIISTTCLQCHTGCNLKAKIVDGKLVKIDGNPYGPQNMFPHIAYETPFVASFGVRGRICPKGQAGIQTAYDPYRVRTVLKRVGARGEGKWKVMEWNDFTNEVVDGGNLFGEGQVSGLKDIFKNFPNDMADDIKKLGKDLTVEQFKEKWKDNLDVLIDPEHPDLGPKNNQFVFMAGRINAGRADFSKRFVNGAFGSVNWFEHTSICEQSHHIGWLETTVDETGAGKTQLKTDIINSEFIIWWGSSPCDANFGPPHMAHKISDARVHRRMKMASIDPRLSNTGAKSDIWVPVKPGGDAALAMGMIRWIIENKRYDEKYLTLTSKEAAKKIGEPTWTNAAYLVKIEDGRPAGLLRADEVGIGKKEQFVVIKDGKPATHDSVDSADLEVETTINDVTKKSTKVYDVKTPFLLMKEKVMGKSMQEWADLCGLNVETIVNLSREFVSHGKKATADSYRGACQHTSGYYMTRAIVLLNVFIGNFDWKGGMAAGGGKWTDMGGKEGSVFDLGAHPGKKKGFGIPLNRQGNKFEKTTLFDQFPAKRPWFPLSSQVWQEIIPSAADGYPYPIKALMLHKGTPAYSVPGGISLIDIIKDTKKIPLLIASDIIIGETTMYADYVIPDDTYLEEWSMPGAGSPDVLVKGSKLRQPTVRALPVKEMKKLEHFFIDVSKKMELPGFGDNGFGDAKPLNYPEEFYLREVANLAYGDKKGEVVPDASDEELQIFERARAHLPSDVYDLARWKSIVGEDKWRKVVFVLNRGGRFENAGNEYAGNQLKYAFGKMVDFYAERVALTKDSMTGKFYDGLIKYEPVQDIMGNEIKDVGYPFQLITFKEILHTQSRTISNIWLNEILPENYIWMNRIDAINLGVEFGDMIKITSPSNAEGVKGKVVVMEGVRPGVIAVSHHYGHWAYGGKDVEIDGNVLKGDKRRNTGITVNPVMRLDPSLKGKSPVCLQDPIGGSASFYDTKVKVEKA